MTCSFLRFERQLVWVKTIFSPFLYISGRQLQENLKDLTMKCSDQAVLQWIHTLARLDYISNHFFISFCRSFQFFVEFIANRFAIVLVFNFYLNFMANTLNLANTNPSSPAIKANLKRTKHCQQID